MNVPSDPWFHTGRRAYFLRHSKGDLALADALCRWDRELRRAVFSDVEELHHGITAAYSATFRMRWRGPGNWLLSSDGPLNVANNIDLNGRNRQEIAAAIQRAGGPQSSEYEILVKLSLGVWNVMTSGRREGDLWVPYIRHAYPRGTSRRTAHDLVTALRDLRNRVCHHESLLGFRLDQHHQLVELCRLLMPAQQVRFCSESRVIRVLGRRPAR